jgi:hypothetical protein
MPTGVWHWTSLDRGLSVPSEWFVAEELGVQCNETEIVFGNGGERKASWIHWNSGLGNASPYLDPYGSHEMGFLKPSNGAILFSTRAALDTVEAETGMHLAWLCRARVYSQKDTSTRYEVTESFFLVS